MKWNLKNVPTFKRAIGLAFVVLTLGGCKMDFQLPSNQEVHMESYQDGRVVFKRELIHGEPYITATNTWLTSHANGWKAGFITRPRGIYLEGDKFYVNALENETCVKYCRTKNLCQLYINKDNSLYYKLQHMMNFTEGKPVNGVGRSSH